MNDFKYYLITDDPLLESVKRSISMRNTMIDAARQFADERGAKSFDYETASLIKYEAVLEFEYNSQIIGVFPFNTYQETVT